MTVNHWWVNGIVDSFWSLVWGIPRAKQWILKCDVGEERKGRGVGTLLSHSQGSEGLYESVMLLSHRHTHKHTQTGHALLLWYIIPSHSAFYTSFCHFQIQYGAVLYCSVFEENISAIEDDHDHSWVSSNMCREVCMISLHCLGKKRCVQCAFSFFLW